MTIELTAPFFLVHSQIEQNDSYLENAHPGVVEGVDLLTEQAKPSAMDAFNPVDGGPRSSSDAELNLRAATAQPARWTSCGP
jgi:hypothetical protein